MTFDFDDITQFKFYKYKDEGPWCFYLVSFSMTGPSEVYFSSNGTYGGDNMPVVFWDGNVKEFKFKTSVTAPGQNTLSFLEMWRAQK